ncbi:hypothetical protein ACOZDE_30020 [Streptomyces griseoincarnatus]
MEGSSQRSGGPCAPTGPIGVIVGTQIAGALLTAGTDAGTKAPAEAAFTTGFAVTGVTAALGLLLVRATRVTRGTGTRGTAESARPVESSRTTETRVRGGPAAHPSVAAVPGPVGPLGGGPNGPGARDPRPLPQGRT